MLECATKTSAHVKLVHVKQIYTVCTSFQQFRTNRIIFPYQSDTNQTHGVTPVKLLFRNIPEADPDDSVFKTL